MLKRIYADNFRTLVNFDLALDSLTLLLGPNGSGKTSALEVVRRIREFLCEEKTANELFPASTLTRWQQQDVQTFELGLVVAEEKYVYRVEIEHEVDRQRCRVKAESLRHNGNLLFESRLEDRQLHAQLYRDSLTRGPEVLVDWARSGVAAIQSSHVNTKLTRFKDIMRQLHVCRLDPMSMAGRAEQESPALAWNGANFVEWFRHVAGVDLELVAKLRPTLEEVLSGYDGLSLVPDGQEAKILRVNFKASSNRESNTNSQYNCRFDELSDGQRVLIALRTLLVASGGDSTLCLDEPENFLALREVQPWMNDLIDRTQEGDCQALLVSHHPILIDALATGCGRWLDRTAGGPTRVQNIADDGSGLKVSELVARGWLHE